MVLPMYLVFRRKAKEDHFLTRAILLSPCGTHFHANWMILVFGQVCTKLVPWFSKGVGMPDILMRIGQKLICDFKSLPASHDLLTYLA